MRVTFEWTQAEWNEAVLLATERARRRGSVPGMVYALVGIPLFGAVLDGVTALRKSQSAAHGGSNTVPLLLLLLAVCLGVAVGVSVWQRRKKMALQAPMPVGQWEVVLQESGWRFGETVRVVETTVVLETVTAVADVPAPVVAVAASQEPVVAAAAMDEATATVPAEIPVTAVPADPAPAAAVVAAVVEAVPDTAVTVASEAASAPPVADGVPPAAESEAKPAEPLPEAVAPAPPPAPAEPLQPWSVLSGSRTSERVIVLLHAEGFHAVPVRCMTPDQASHMHRMVIRKLRPAPAPRNLTDASR